MEGFKFNPTQSLLSEDVLNKLDKEVRGELIDCLTNIRFLINITNHKRHMVKDMPKDDIGRVIVNFAAPHILEDMDFFRQSALHYKQYGCYTLIPENKIPGSDYNLFWKEEARRCRDGLVRNDGEWIPGYFYFYLNYTQISLTRADNSFARSTTSLKEKALRTKDFPDIYDGDYLYFHYIERCRDRGEHAAVLKRRGVGASLKAASMLARNFVIGEKELKSGIKDPTVSYAIANEKEYLNKDGVLNKFVDNIDWCATSTPFPRIRELKDSINDMHWKMGYKDSENGTEGGTGNEVMGVSMKDNPQKARGKRGVLILWEESGKAPHLLQAWNIARESIEEGRYTYGTMACFGTGGTEGADFTALKELFYNPIGYNILSLDNVYDKISENSACSFFWGAYLNRKGCFDKDGNSDVISALIEVLNDRITVKRNSSDPNALTQRKCENPITPQEAMMIRRGTIFPVNDILDYLSEILPNEKRFTSGHWVGRIRISQDGIVDWCNSEDNPIREYPLIDQNNKTGAIEIYEMPVKSSNGKTTPFRYISGGDPVDDDYSTTNSLANIWVFDRFTDRIVAEYTGRPRFADDYYEICRRLLLFYGATMNYENDKKGLYGYFRNKNCLYLLCDNLEILEDKNISNIKQNYGNKKKGTNSGVEVNAWGRRLQAEWMMQPARGTGYTKDDGTEVPPKINLHMIRSIAYLKECSMWNPDGNFDRISGAGMLFLYREDLKRLDIVIKEDNSNTKANNPFWSRLGGLNEVNNSVRRYESYNLFER
jgi:hypothetical protein